MAEESTKINVSVGDDSDEEEKKENVVKIEPSTSSIDEAAKQAAEQLEATNEEINQPTEPNEQPEEHSAEVVKTNSKIIVSEEEESASNIEHKTEDAPENTSEPIQVNANVSKKVIQPITPNDSPSSEENSSVVDSLNTQTSEETESKSTEHTEEQSPKPIAQPTVADLATDNKEQTSQTPENIHHLKPTPAVNYKIDPKKLKKGPKNINSSKDFSLAKLLILVTLVCVVAGAYYAYTQLI